MLASQAVRHLPAALAIAVFIVAQPYGTRIAGAHYASPSDTFGVELLARDLTSPDLLDELGSHSTALTKVNAPSPAVSFVPRPRFLSPNPARGRTAAPLALLPSEVDGTETKLAWPENRDATGALIRLTENDVLIPISISF